MSKRDERVHFVVSPKHTTITLREFPVICGEPNTFAIAITGDTRAATCPACREKIAAISPDTLRDARFAAELEFWQGWRSSARARPRPVLTDGEKQVFLAALNTYPSECGKEMP